MSLSDAAGVGGSIELGGERLEVTPRLLRHYAEIEAEIIRRRPDPFDAIRNNKDIFADSPELLDKFVEKAFEEAKKIREVGLVEIGRYITESWHGQLFAIWLTIRDNDRQKWTLEHFTRVFSDEYEDRISASGEEAAKAWMEGIEKTIDRASGEDELGNSTGSPPSTPETEPQTSMNP